MRSLVKLFCSAEILGCKAVIYRARALNENESYFILGCQTLQRPHDKTKVLFFPK